MAVKEHTSGFGKRAIHRVWSDGLREAEFVCLSPIRAWTAITLLLVVSLLCRRAAYGFAARDLWPAQPAYSPAPAAATLLAVAAGCASLWAAYRVLSSVLRPGPVLRLDPSRLVLRTRDGHLVLTWEEVTVSLGRLFLTLRARRAAGSKAGLVDPDEILVPVFLIEGGPAALRAAIGRVRPDRLHA